MCKYTKVDDDKYVKSATKPPQKVVSKSIPSVPKYLVIWACFVVASYFATFGVSFEIKILWDFISIHLEILGLVLLREKIKSRNGVSGISGMTMVMHSMTYFTRVSFDIAWGKLTLDKYQMPLLLLEICPLLLVLDILRSVFVTYKSSYKADIDVLDARYLIAACMFMTLVARVDFEGYSRLQSLATSVTLYMDAVSLMPQIVMMAKSGGGVEVPILHYVAATGIARSGDMFNTIFASEMATNMSNFECVRHWMAGDLDDSSSHEVLSWVVTVIAQGVQLVLIADFLYHYFRARTWKSTNAEIDILWTTV